MLSDLALSLIRDVFSRPDLFADLPRITQRVVAWGPAGEATALPHSAVVVSEELLLDSLRPGLTLAEGSADNQPPDFTVFASRPLPAEAHEHRFGTRLASAVEVRLRNDADVSTCWIESFDGGWLFLIPRAGAGTWLLAVGSTPERLLESSRVIGPRVELLTHRSGEFAACPRIISPLGGTDWLACGTAAMAFDPVCGDGTAHAVREAILAAAAIRAAAADRANAEAIVAHYSARLTAGFMRHLQLCREFYRSGGTGPWWTQELEALETGLAWCESAALRHGKFRYRLDGFDLVAL